MMDTVSPQTRVEDLRFRCASDERNKTLGTFSYQAKLQKFPKLIFLTHIHNILPQTPPKTVSWNQT